MENLAFHIIKTNVIASFFILVVYITSHFLKAKYTAMWKYAAWLAIAVFLLIPVNPLDFAAPLRLVIPDAQAESYQPAADTVTVHSADRLPHGDTNTSLTSGKGYSEDTAPVIEPRQFVVYSRHISLYGLLQAFMILWSAGFLLLALFRTGLYHFSLGRLNRWSLPEDDRQTLALYSFVCKKQHIKRPPKLMVNTKITSPVLAGLTKTKMYIPAGHYSAEELQLIFSHELSHYRYHDLWYKLLLLCITTVHWFNPALYLMKREAEKDVENLRDGNVLKHCSQSEQRLYTQLLLKTAAGVHLLPYLATSLNDSTLVFKERIRYMVKERTLKPKITPALFLSAVLLLCGTLVGCSAIQLPDMPPKSASNKTDGTEKAAESEPNSNETAKVNTIKISPAVFGSYNLPAGHTDAKAETIPKTPVSANKGGTADGNTQNAGNPVGNTQNAGNPTGSTQNTGNLTGNSVNGSNGSVSGSGASNGNGNLGSGSGASGGSNNPASGSGSSGSGSSDGLTPVPPETEANSATISGTVLTVDTTSFEVQNPDGTTDWYWYDPGWVEFSNGGNDLSAGDSVNITYYTDTKEVQSIYTN